MRIVAGTHRSRKLETPKSNAVRPTSDKVRQAVFNMLNSRGFLADAIVIDVCCGTGALGLEALSQGAEFCTFFDKNKDSIAVCRANVKSLKEEGRSKVIFQDAIKLKPRFDDIKPATLVFLDPPYNQNLIAPAITSLIQSNWLAKECVFVIETEKTENIISDSINIIHEKNYGDTKITLAELIG